MEFKHQPVMLNECVTNLAIKPNGIYLDGTLGGGGHSAEILSHLTTGRLLAFDKDETAIDFCKQKFKDNPNITFFHDDFKNFSVRLDEAKIDGVDGILLDLGVSSYQIDTPERGFSYMLDAPLDMRMNLDQAKTASDVVNHYTETELEDIFSRFGEEPFSRRIAHAIMLARKNRPIDTTLQLVDIIQKIVPPQKASKGHPAKRVFQALRIEVNGELDKLQDCIVSMARRLNTNGRLCVLTFHSLEDRIVKDAFNMLSSDCICDKKLPICVCHHKREVKLVNKKPLTASEQELTHNPRSHSAKLRVVQKL